MAQWPGVNPERLKGKVVLVDFLDPGCINCQHTLPYVRDWANKYRAAGLVLIGVHTPEYPWERSLPLLRQAVKGGERPTRLRLRQSILAGALHFRRSRAASLYRLRRRDYARRSR